MQPNADPGTLTVRQISQHLHTKAWNVTRELQLGRLIGTKLRGEGHRGRGGSWLVRRDDYLDFLGIEQYDLMYLGTDGLPKLTPLPDAAAELELDPRIVQSAVSLFPLAHIAVGRKRYLTHHQLIRLRELRAELAASYRDNSR